MLEDLKAEKTKQASDERRRQASKDAYDARIHAYFMQHLPVIEQFCSESGWTLNVDEMSRGQVHPFRYGGLERNLHVFVAGPERQCRGREYDSVTKAGLHIHFWSERHLLNWAGLSCMTYCTTLQPYDRLHDKSWWGVSHNKLEQALRKAYRLFGDAP